MTSSKTLKKIVSIGAALMLALGGSLVATTPAAATGALSLTTAPTFTPTTTVTTATSMSASYGSWANAPLGTGGGAEFWRICDSDPSLLSATDGSDVPVNLGCHTVYTSFSSPNEFTGTGLTLDNISALDSASNTVTASSLVGKYVARISIVKLYASPNTLYGWAFSTSRLIQGAPPAPSSPSPVITGTASVGSVLTATSGTWTGSPTSYRYQWVTKELNNSMCAWATTDIAGATSSTYTVASGDAGKCITVKVWASNANGESTYSATVWPEVQIPASVSNNNSSNTCAGPTGVTSYAASSATLSPGGSYRLVYNGNPALNGCLLSVQGFATGRFLNGTLLGSFYYMGTVTGLQVSQYAYTFGQLETLAGRPLVNGDVVTGKIWVSPGMTQPSQNSAGDFSYTVTITGVSSTSTDSTDVTDITEDQRPLPVWASNIVSSIPTLTKALVSTGGSVALTGGDYADLKSVTIGGKAVAFKIETTGHVNIPVPAGEAGKTADIVIVFGGGTMTVQDGIKYVAQVDVAKVAERPIAIAAGAKKITEAIADQIRQAAFANPKNTHIQCVAYAANSSAKAQAAAKLTAVQACGIAAKANPALKISEVSVIVNKAKARQSAVGIKVYKQN